MQTSSWRSIWPFEFRNQRKKNEKIEYLENEKSFLDKINKSHLP